MNIPLAILLVIATWLVFIGVLYVVLVGMVGVNLSLLQVAGIALLIDGSYKLLRAAVRH